MSRIVGSTLLLVVSLAAIGSAAPVEIPRPQTPIDPVSQVVAAADLALTSLGASTGSQWRVHSINGATGTVHLAYGSGIDLGIPVDTPETAVRIARRFVADHEDVFGADVENLEAWDVPRAPGKWAVNFRQTFQGLPVIGGRVDICMTDTGRLFVLGSDYYPDIDIDTAPAISSDLAHAIALTALGVEARAVPRDARLVVLPVHEAETVSHRLVHEVWHRTEEPVGLWGSYVDAHDGRILWRTNQVRHLDVAGTVTGVVEDPDYCAEPGTLPVANMYIVIDGTEDADTTDADGDFSIPAGTEPVILRAMFEGPYLDVDLDPEFGPDSRLYIPAVPGEPVAVHWDTLSSRWDERDCFYHGNRAHDFILALDPTNTDLNYAMPCSVALAGGCNAFWDGHGIYFFRQEEGCANTGRIGDVIIHEYGHAVTYFMYDELGDQPPGSVHEGNSDILPNLILGRSLIANGFYLTCNEGLRDSDNTLCWPDDLQDVGHLDGQMLAGFIWDAYQLLIASLGEEAAREVTASAWHFGRKLGKPMSMVDQVFWTFAGDDDDGNLDNGTPHYEAFCRGAENHCFACTDYGVVIAHEATGPLWDADVPIAIDAKIFSTLDDLKADSLLVRYSVSDNGSQEVLLTGSDEDSIYAGEIPAQEAGEIVKYFIAAEDLLGNRTTDPKNAPDDLHFVYVDPTVGDDLEADTGWTVGAPGDDATDGFWERVDPVGTWWFGDRPVQPEDDHTSAPGAMCYVTDQLDGNEHVLSNDVDRGTTSLMSPAYNLSGASYAELNYYRWFTDDLLSSPEDEYWVVQVRNDGGPWIDLENTTESRATWTRRRFHLHAILGEGLGMIQVAFRATDGPEHDNLVEAGVDDFWITTDLGGGTVQVEPVVDGLPVATEFGPISPNPLRAGTAVRYALARDGNVRLDVFDVSGRHVRTLVRTRQAAGRYALRWDGRSDRQEPVGAGVYFAKLRVDADVLVRRLTVVR